MSEVPNPNNCDTCGHKKNPDGGHCYMFRGAPTEVCMQHTLRATHQRLFRNPIAVAAALAVMMPSGAGPFEPIILDRNITSKDD